MKKVETKYVRRGLLAIAAIVLITIAVWGLVFYLRATSEYAGTEPVRLSLASSFTADDVKSEMKAKLGEDYGAEVYRMWEFFDGTPASSYGSYVVEPGMEAYVFARNIARGRQTPVRLTFNNIRLLGTLAARVASRLDIDSAAFMMAMDSILPAHGFTKASYPAAFVPNTYEFYWTAPAEEVVERLLESRNDIWTDARVAKAKKLGLSKVEVATLASIVEEETAKKDERPMIARLYLNRLQKGMKLQADPTVKYAVGDFSLRRIYNRHLESPSPYNTYLHEGLPPGPIRIAELSAIDAVLDAPAHTYLYMCAKEDFSGYHNFASDYAGHEANARRYRAALNKRNIR